MTCVDQSGQRAADPGLCAGVEPSSVQHCSLERCGGACQTGCLGRGRCAADGSCACAGGYSGAYCQVLTRAHC